MAMPTGGCIGCAPQWPLQLPTKIFVFANNAEVDDTFIERIASAECGEPEVCAAVMCNHGEKQIVVTRSFGNIYWMSRLNPFKKFENWTTHVNGGSVLSGSLRNLIQLLFLVSNTRSGEDRSANHTESDTDELLEAEQELFDLFGPHYRLNESDVWARGIPSTQVFAHAPLPNGNRVLSTGAIAVFYWMHAMPSAVIHPIGFTKANTTDLEPHAAHNYAWEWAEMEKAPRFDPTLNSPNPFASVQVFRDCASCIDSTTPMMTAARRRLYETHLRAF